jgi:hypothetical protein
MASTASSTRLANLTQEATFKLKRSKEYLTSVSILLAECKRCVDAGDPNAEGASWAGYCRVHFPDYSLSHNGKLLQVASQPDRPDKEDAFDRVWAGFIALDRKRQHEFLCRGAAHVARSEDKTERSVSGAPADLPGVVDQLA